ncbi:MAG TPA: prepilin-type N-terminal cleavage/methylation domain-containing protein [Trueperaceae bacterium]
MRALEAATTGSRATLGDPVPARSAAGFTLVETLVALAMLGVVLAIGFFTLRPSLEMRAARAMRALLLQARTQAIWSGLSVAVVETAGGSAFVAREFDPASACSDGRVLATLRLRDFPGVRLSDGLRAGGIYWLPSGGGRSCAGGGVISDTVLLQGPRGGAAVVVSSLGRVRLEARP